MTFEDLFYNSLKSYVTTWEVQKIKQDRNLLSLYCGKCITSLRIIWAGQSIFFVS